MQFLDDVIFFSCPLGGGGMRCSSVVIWNQRCWAGNCLTLRKLFNTVTSLQLPNISPEDSDVSYLKNLDNSATLEEMKTG